MADNSLTGSHWVRLLGAAAQDAKILWPATRHRMEVRRNALKLRFWPEQHPMDDSGTVLDLDWEWIRALKGKRVGELRIHDRIGGIDNIRLIFFVGDIVRPSDPMKAIWILAAKAKKRDDFTAADIRTFDARRTIVMQRFYV